MDCGRGMNEVRFDAHGFVGIEVEAAKFMIAVGSFRYYVYIR